MTTMKTRWLSILLSVMIVLGVTPVMASETMDDDLSADMLEQGTLKTTLEKGIFQITATEEKTVKIDSSSKVANDGTTFAQRIKLGGSGKADYRSIHFTLSTDATVTVYAMSSSSSSDRALDVFGLDGERIDGMDAPGKSLNMKAFSLTAGDYYLASPSSGVNVYGVFVVKSGEEVQIERLDWAAVKAPIINEIVADGTKVSVDFSLETGTDGADKAEVYMMNDQGEIVDTKLIGKGTEENKTAVFSLDASGVYSFQVSAMRNDEATTLKSEVKELQYKLPLETTSLSAFNNQDGTLTVKWTAVEEAESYVVETKLVDAESYTSSAETKELEATIQGLKVGEKYDVRVKALRGDDASISEAIAKTIKKAQEREWVFTYFGQSTKDSRNTFEMIDEEAMVFKLNSCTVNDDGSIKDKGGKYTTYHDGISYYYTKVDPTKENFVMTATFKVDYINVTPDGQEGFGLIAMDSLGKHGVSSVNHYTNSAGIIATKFQETIDGTKYSSKDTLGSRFVTGITEEALNAGDSGIAENGKSVKHGFSYDKEDLIEAGKSYTLTLKKTNTGYHAYMDGYEEQILYGVDELLKLDPENIYVGFSVARGCNVTVTDFSFTTSDPKTDPVAMEKPVEYVSYRSKIDSPLTSSSEDYNFVYVSDVPGALSIKAEDGKVIVDSAVVTKDKDFQESLSLALGENKYSITFTPDASYIPGENQKLESYDPVTVEHIVTYKTFDGAKVYVTPDGNSEGTGSKESPLDIYTATAYAKSGQVIMLADGTYKMPKSLIIARGIDGTKDEAITMQSEAGGRAILNFEEADSGMVLWGNYWVIENIDITKAPGNKKGLQIAGDNNIISGVNAYRNGDTGIQISGTSSETIEKWPSNNLILNCTSYDNMDPGMNNADGFAAKITVAEGNVFDGCMAYNNLDDGWDLFAKAESGVIGKVVIKNSIAFNNGTLTDGTGKGDGNGFKLGGDGISVAHELINCISYNNNETGITSNSNPAVIIKDCTAYGNKGRNIALYGKGSSERKFVLDHVISMAGAEDDDVDEMPSLLSESNYLSVAGVATNKSGNVLSDKVFLSTDVSIMPTRAEDGSIVMNGLLAIDDSELAIQSASVSTEKTYIVQDGDTLSKIADKVYNDPYAWEKIYEANKTQIKDPSMIYVGQKLVLPE